MNFWEHFRCKVNKKKKSCLTRFQLEGNSDFQATVKFEGIVKYLNKIFQLHIKMQVKSSPNKNKRFGSNHFVLNQVMVNEWNPHPLADLHFRCKQCHVPLPSCTYTAWRRPLGRLMTNSVLTMNDRNGTSYVENFTEKNIWCSFS